ncbi:MAG TPA: acyl-CoA desaturase [Solirubrobacteraceae bacterium]|nr:acyl-CoA desaturase [Solirubrobacteraceae bacterium]
MTRGEKIVNMIGVVVPFLGFIAAVVLLWNKAIDLIDVGIMVATYVAVGFGVTVGYHRMLTHRSFQTSKPMEYLFAILGSMSLQGPVLDWVADHRKHHAHTDEEGDPHSPHVGGGHGLRGLIHAHVGWIFVNQGQADWRKYARDLYEDETMKTINRLFPLWALLSVGIPALAGFVLHGFTAEGALRGLVWGGLVRIFFLHHITWSINSVCHFFGQRRFDVEDHSTNVALLALPSLGEAWHHNHHAFPRSASHGMKRWEAAMDPSAWLIAGMEKVGLVWNVVRITPERQAQKLAPVVAAPRAAARVEREAEREKVGV